LVVTTHISGTAAATVVKFCIQVGYIKSHHTMTNYPLKGRGRGQANSLNFWK